MGRSGSGAGSCLGLAAVAAVSTSIILISYHLHRRLVANMKDKIVGEGGADKDRRRRRPRGTKKAMKKVRFADDVVEPSSNNEEYRRRVWSSSSTTISGGAVAAAGGSVDEELLSLSRGPPPRTGDALLALPAPTHAMRRRTVRLPEPDACRQA
ncbi:hypothetical protein SEVIR_3G404566v4 [Setaria viridis]|nr:uncharacterized protein LOC101774714 [Setaria italica]XP_034588690.1 uncharacterized protein LOC117850912 [Setaria viridis]